ncbi:hypothetical protein B9Q01_09205 [Candidatus Marsarchaeota G1 archaeon OSP_D]|jgi:hypothetical protein|uniref:Aspartate carbamoyltransferase regulatory subunit C-terminal domain-containing protein n=4 Tax=Candidatus Marsarchaeota TaxID=1978152 RepID=A0A2R6BZM4_9ARCH|nr:MAG: hypothetical protein B9Q01_09205 [Candidatus Marsarchaeota G1 archaeon OSP_D]PSN84848.1 MAG: hypothetical protein B9Q02_08565 [Candidatus Marsarchaeota G1 archaeon BE_D]PSN86981.1 MAG: hypothetical protein B9Q00_10050 [Candidatus Marsarchaeota G1 archaeon OSP_C]PSO04074.1 MAG: hypothetical protein B9Q12_03070 [Candidatus Marsarchaeota G2 archaeon ECH_B_SAG-G06]
MENVTVVLHTQKIEPVLKLLENSEATIQKKQQEVRITLKQAPNELLLKILLLYEDAKFYVDSEEFTPEFPGVLSGFMNCPNANCVTSQPREPVKPEFVVVRKSPPLLQCSYCGRYVPKEAITPELLTLKRFVPPW